jgi:cytochrome P450
VINADGEVWRFHRRVTGPVFSERIHRVVWQESMNQAHLMMQSWLPSTNRVDSVRIPSFGNDTLRLGLNVITGAAYGCPLGWNENPPCASSTSLSYHASVEQLTEHLMSIFLTPRWLLRFARRDSTWGRAWEAYTAFGSYIRGMLDRERAHLDAGDGTEDNLLTALIRAEQMADEKESRSMEPHEVLGNAFIFLFAGHETTANTLHYAMILLAQHPDIQELLLDEIDEVYDRAALEGRDQLEYELDFNRARWAFAIMVR